MPLLVKIKSDHCNQQIGFNGHPFKKLITHVPSNVGYIYIYNVSLNSLNHLCTNALVQRHIFVQPSFSAKRLTYHSCSLHHRLYLQQLSQFNKSPFLSCACSAPRACSAPCACAALRIKDHCSCFIHHCQYKKSKLSIRSHSHAAPGGWNRARHCSLGLAGRLGKGRVS